MSPLREKQFWEINNDKKRNRRMPIKLKTMKLGIYREEEALTGEKV